MPICPPSLALRRIEPEKNVARFYALAVERDLFGRIVLVRQWGRIGTDGRRRHDEHKTEAEEAAAWLPIATIPTPPRQSTTARTAVQCCSTESTSGIFAEAAIPAALRPVGNGLDLPTTALRADETQGHIGDREVLREKVHVHGRCVMAVHRLAMGQDVSNALSRMLPRVIGGISVPSEVYARRELRPGGGIGQVPD